MKNNVRSIVVGFLLVLISCSTGFATTDILESNVYRHEPSGWIVFEVGFSTLPLLDHVRLLIDVDGQTSGLRSSGADYMIEGNYLYRYPEGAQGWTWDRMESALVLQQNNSLYFVVRSLSLPGPFNWSIQLSDSAWKTIETYPSRGSKKGDGRKLNVLSPDKPLASINLVPYLESQPLSLSIRLDSEIKNTLWLKQTDNSAPVWQVPFSPDPLPLRLTLMDTGANRAISLELQETLTCENAEYRRYVGDHEEVDVIIEVHHDRLDVSGQIRSDQDRCFSVGIGCGLDLVGWWWGVGLEDDVEIESGKHYERSISSADGNKQTRSLYPFGVIRKQSAAMMVNHDLREPRLYRISADADAGWFGITYDMATTMQTSNFPGRAAFECSFTHFEMEAESAFRQAVQTLSGRYKEHDVSSPVSIGSVSAELPGSDGFNRGVAYFTGPLSAEAFKVCEASGVSPMLTTDPWSYQVAEPIDWALEYQGWVSLLNLHSIIGNIYQREQAQSAELGGARSIEQTHVFNHVSTHALMREIPVNTDPDFPVTSEYPVNRAMVQMAGIRQWVKDNPVKGVIHRHMGDRTVLDYNPMALHVADYPCVYSDQGKVPAQWLLSADHEYVSMLSHYLNDEDMLLGAEGGMVLLPSLWSFYDIYMHHNVDLPDRAVIPWDYYRIMAGKKPFLYFISADSLTSKDIFQIVDHCLYWGIIPYYQSDLATILSNLSLRKAQAESLFTIESLIQPLAEAGWHAEQVWENSHPSVIHEEYGALNKGMSCVTLCNRSDTTVVSTLTPLIDMFPSYMINPFTASVVIRDKDHANMEVVLLGRQTDVRYIIPLASPVSVVDRWYEASEIPALCRENIESAQREYKMGLLAECRLCGPVIAGEPNRIELTIQNVSKKVCQLLNVNIITSKHYEPVACEEMQLNHGESGSVVCSFTKDDLGEEAWIEVQWIIEMDGMEHYFSRKLRPAFVPALDIELVSHSIKEGLSDAAFELTATNISTHPQEITVNWEGDFEDGKQHVLLPADTATRVAIPVQKRHTHRGQLLITVEHGDQTVLKEWVDVEIVSSQ